MRGKNLEVSKREGLNIESIEGDIFVPPDELRAYGDVQDIGKVDWVILCLKSTALIGADNETTLRSLLLPLLDKDTRIITIMNGMIDDDIVRILQGHTLKTPVYADANADVDLEASNRDSSTPAPLPNLTKCAATYGGMALLCSNRIEPGRIKHTHAGKLTVSLAYSSSDDTETMASHRHAIEELWLPTRGFECCYDDNLVRARWSKNLWNLPFNGVSVAMGGITIDRVVEDPGLRSLVYIVMDETIAVANKDLQSRGFTSEYFLGQVEVKQTIGSIYFAFSHTYIHTYLLTFNNDQLTNPNRCLCECPFTYILNTDVERSDDASFG